MNNKTTEGSGEGERERREREREREGERERERERLFVVKQNEVLEPSRLFGLISVTLEPAACVKPQFG